MSGAVTAIAVTSVAGVANSIYQGNKQARAQKKAASQAQANADRQAKAADEANNRANQKRPDTMALLDAASQSGKSGASSTMLTSPAGIDTGALTLGKNTLLGG